ncbi:EscU/YscU/HrcU family type III secretion system export apparatus switch protein [Sediminispirochaeta bajacaliforniensis]|uniref:EscU/YscU/HrcU family type III secretion system export apparatus switch protein n=1 Tax=Sediminispirochaeta bajacaliforniensis TaxID=148 RepID=UPI000363E2D9|nr:EscU/YscU/HrcU family type III secretion system export apparatus switch protein [Sediminispirochaeta bajacaliforniensis]
MKKRMLEKAIALAYDRDTYSAPRITAKGSGEAAKRLLALAKKHGVPVMGDEELVQRLYLFDLEAVIPEDLYEVVAEIYSFVWKLREGA